MINPSSLMMLLAQTSKSLNTIPQHSNYQTIPFDSTFVDTVLLKNDAPLLFKSLSVSANLIQIKLDSLTISYHFTDGYIVTAQIQGDPQTIQKFQGTQDDYMKQILDFYINRQGTVIEKFILKDQNAFSILQEMGIFEEFDVRSWDGYLITKEIGKLPDEVLEKMEWILDDKRVL